MSLLIQTPHRPDIARRTPYRRYLNMLSRNETAVQRALRRGGSGQYETDMQATLLAVCEWLGPDCVFYDVGAHVGYYSAMAATLFKGVGIRVVAFEPTPDTANIARAIRSANGLDYEIIQAAVADVPGSVELFLSPKAETSNSLDGTFREGSVPVTVRAMTIDEYVAGGGPIPNFIKVDVETFEHAVLIGGMKTIADARPYLTCEILPTENFSAMAAVLDRLEDIGYRFYQISDAAQWMAHRAADVEPNLDSVLRDWLFLPQEMPTELPELIASWRSSLEQCDADTNIGVKSGSILKRTIRSLKSRRLLRRDWNGDS